MSRRSGAAAGSPNSEGFPFGYPVRARRTIAPLGGPTLQPSGRAARWRRRTCRTAAAMARNDGITPTRAVDWENKPEPNHSERSRNPRIRIAARYVVRLSPRHVPDAERGPNRPVAALRNCPVLAVIHIDTLGRNSIAAARHAKLVLAVGISRVAERSAYSMIRVRTNSTVASSSGARTRMRSWASNRRPSRLPSTTPTAAPSKDSAGSSAVGRSLNRLVATRTRLPA